MRRAFFSDSVDAPSIHSRRLQMHNVFRAAAIAMLGALPMAASALAIIDACFNVGEARHLPM
ncbi:MAG: hypothetical protein M3R31_03780, partial [Pseudomonadota bacterium]|nr:hypothetical protein [Pseudomonadota bacterium]